MYCDNCGARIDDDSVFCENCGVLVKQEELVTLQGSGKVTKDTAELQPLTDLGQLMDEEGFKEDFTGSQDMDKSAPSNIEESTELPEPIESEQIDAKNALEEAAEVSLNEMDSEEFSNQPECNEPVDEERASEQAEIEVKAEKVDADDMAQPAALFCMACGRKLPDGAAFCDACGTPTGEVMPPTVHMRNVKQTMFVELVKTFFKKPADTIEKAATEDAFLAGIGFYLIKDVIVAVLSAVFMGSLTAAFGSLGELISGGDLFGFGARIFLIAVLMDALWVGLLYGIGLLFRGTGSFKSLVGSCGTASILASALLILTIVLTGVFPAASVCGGIVTIAALIITTNKAVDAVLDLSSNLRIYMLPAAVLCYGIIITAVINILRML